jgi:hypothetical protein
MSRTLAMLVLSVLLTAIVMYACAQLMRVEVSTGGLLGNIAAILGLALIALILNLMFPVNHVTYCFGAIIGIALGIYTDAIWPLASDVESNIWPIAIFLWWVLATPGTMLAIYLAQKQRDRGKSNERAA